MTRKNGLQLMWSAIKSAILREESKGIYVGRDYFGNRYFEKPPDPSKGKKSQRILIASDPDPTKVPEIPVEWTTWLQGRRKNPPADEEIERNYHVMVKTQLRATELERSRMEELEEDQMDLKPQTAKTPFPKYDDLETRPGQFQEKNKNREDTQR